MRVLWASLLLIVFDQITKVIVKTQMQYGESIPVIGDLLKWTFTENPGMAFGVELGGGGDAGKLFLSVFSVLATILILVYIAHVRTAPLGYRLSLAFILGGATGNVIDRVFYGVAWDYAPLGFGKVVDFIHIDVWSGYVADSVPFFGGRYLAVFPIGNIADLAIIAGVVGVLWFQKAFHAHLDGAEALAPAEVSESGVSGAAPPPASSTPSAGPALEAQSDTPPPVA